MPDPTITLPRPGGDDRHCGRCPVRYWEISPTGECRGMGAACRVYRYRVLLETDLSRQGRRYLRWPECREGDEG